MPMLSVIIICRDEADQIGDCLDSVAWADEIIVVDSESSDHTRDIAARYTRLVHTVPWKGFGPQKNHALSLATGDWVLSIDCDERADPELEAEVRRVISAPDAAGYELPRSNWFCGRRIRFGDWSGDWVVRLFRRDRGRFTDDAVHERIVVEGHTGRLRHGLAHHTIRTRDQHREKIRYYTELTTRIRREQGRTATIYSAAGHGLWTLFRGYLLRGGFLDGTRGWHIASGQARSVWWRYKALARGIPADQAAGRLQSLDDSSGD